MAYRVHSVPKYRTYPTCDQKLSMLYTLEECSRIYIMWRIDSNDASLSAVSVRAVQNPYNKEIPKYARSEGGKFSESGRH